MGAAQSGQKQAQEIRRQTFEEKAQRLLRVGGSGPSEAMPQWIAPQMGATYTLSNSIPESATYTASSFIR